MGDEEDAGGDILLFFLSKQNTDKFLPLEKGQERYELKIPSSKTRVNTKRKVRY
jgi:hypothetical protein